MLSDLHSFVLGRLWLFIVLFIFLFVAVWLTSRKISDPAGRSSNAAPTSASAAPGIVLQPGGSDLVSVSVNASAATGGSTDTGTVMVRGTGGGNTIVLLTSSNPAVQVPKTIVVDSATTTAIFPIVTIPVSSPTTATITATAGHPAEGASRLVRTAALTIMPAFSLGQSVQPGTSGQPYAARPVTDAPVPHAVAYRVIAGSESPFTDSSGNVWAPGTAYLSGGANIVSSSAAVSNTPDKDLYRSQRVGSVFTITFAVPNGNYLLALLFAQVDGTVTGPGQRVCTVSANGQTLLDHFDSYASAGAGTAVSQAVPVTVTGGSLVLTFTGSGTLGTAAVAAVQLGLLPAGGGITPSIPGLSAPQPDMPAPPWGSDSVPMDN